MKAFKIALSLSLLLVSNAFSSKTLLLIDTAHGEKYQHQPIVSMAKSLGFETKYISISKIMDSTNVTLAATPFDAAFFLFSIEFLKKMEYSPVAKKVLSLLEEFSSQPKKLIGLIFPSGIHQGISPFNPIFEKIGIKLERNALDIIPGKTTVPFKAKPHEQKSIVNFVQETNKFLSFPIASRGVEYDTMIFQPQTSPKNSKDFSGNSTTLAMLPIKKNFKSETEKLLPFGIYWHNPIKNNHLFVCDQSSLGHSSIAEDFRITPAKFSLRKDMLNAVHEMFWELFSVFNSKEKFCGINLVTVNDFKKPNLPKNFQDLGQQVEPDTKIKAPWMAIEIFFDEKNLDKQKKLVDYIFSSDLTHLWLSIAPNWYYSPIGLRKNTTGPDGPNGVKKMINSFTQKLSAKAKRLNKPIPKILIGFEIANNLRGKNIPYKNKAYDLYGNFYDDAPAPLNDEFWNEEVVTSLEKFVDDWKQVSNNIPISGVMLDLEMYVKSTGTFLSTMGFDLKTFNNFLHNPQIQIYLLVSSVVESMRYPGKKNIFARPKDTYELTQYLMNNKLTTKYFDFLNSGAEKLALRLQNTFKRLIPNCIIGCYAPNISPAWFYKGFYKGLSDFGKPMMLFTFNAEFDSHKNWLQSNDIHVKHCGALMLSKIEKPKHYAWVDKILKRHDGLWLNRFSSLVEKYVVYPEHTPLSKKPQELKGFMDHLSRAGK
ncbi:hypothetical protein KAW80_02775 [Candidatus Babeliales bacterium]|nr:hypothetical protein [Candidatus Babeliales bacterium]